MAKQKKQPQKGVNPQGKPSREEYLYHNTLKLLQKYRDVVWSVEAAVIQTRLNFELEFECTIEDFLDLSYAAGADLSGTDIEGQMRTIERNKKMLRIVDNAVEVINNLREHCKDMSWDTFYRKRKEAISCLGSLLGGYTSKDCNAISTTNQVRLSV